MEESVPVCTSCTGVLKDRKTTYVIAAAASDALASLPEVRPDYVSKQTIFSACVIL